MTIFLSSMLNLNSLFNSIKIELLILTSIHIQQLFFLIYLLFPVAIYIIDTYPVFQTWLCIPVTHTHTQYLSGSDENIRVPLINTRVVWSHQACLDMPTPLYVQQHQFLVGQHGAEVCGGVGSAPQRHGSKVLLAGQSGQRFHSKCWVPSHCNRVKSHNS